MASFARRFTEKFAAAAGTRLALAANKWLVIVHAAKVLALDDFAMLAATLSVAEILRIVSDSGTESIIYARARTYLRPMPIFVRSCFQLRTLASATVCIFASTLFIASGGHATYLPLLFLILPLSLQSSAIALLQRDASRRKFAALVSSATASFAIAGAVLLLRAPTEAFAHALLILVPEIAVTVAALILVRPQVYELSRKRKHFVRGLKTIYRLLWRSAVGAAIVIAYSRLDVLIVKPMLGEEAQASFSAGFRLIEPSAVLFGFAATVLLSELGARGGGELKSSISQLLVRVDRSRSLIAFAIPFVTGAVAATLATEILHFSPQASTVAGMLGFAVPVRAASAILTSIQIRFGQMTSVLLATIINLSMTLMISLIFAPKNGIYAVCAAALAGELASMAFQLSNLVRLWKLPPSPSGAAG